MLITSTHHHLGMITRALPSISLKMGSGTNSSTMRASSQALRTTFFTHLWNSDKDIDTYSVKGLTDDIIYMYIAIILESFEIVEWVYVGIYCGVYQSHFGDMDCLKLFQCIGSQWFYSSHQLLLTIGHTLFLDMEEGRAKLRMEDEQMSIQTLLTLLHFPAASFTYYNSKNNNRQQVLY